MFLFFLTLFSQFCLFFFLHKDIMLLIVSPANFGGRYIKFRSEAVTHPTEFQNMTAWLELIIQNCCFILSTNADQFHYTYIYDYFLHPPLLRSWRKCRNFRFTLKNGFLKLWPRFSFNMKRLWLNTWKSLEGGKLVGGWLG